MTVNLGSVKINAGTWLNAEVDTKDNNWFANPGDFQVFEDAAVGDDGKTYWAKLTLDNFAPGGSTVKFKFKGLADGNAFEVSGGDTDDFTDFSIEFFEPTAAMVAARDAAIDQSRNGGTYTDPDTGSSGTTAPRADGDADSFFNKPQLPEYRAFTDGIVDDVAALPNSAFVEFSAILTATDLDGSPSSGQGIQIDPSDLVTDGGFPGVTKDVNSEVVIDAATGYARGTASLEDDGGFGDSDGDGFVSEQDNEKGWAEFYLQPTTKVSFGAGSGQSSGYGFNGTRIENPDPKPPVIDDTDTDNDGIPDVEDIDDDNDGILDTEECEMISAIERGTISRDTRDSEFTEVLTQPLNGADIADGTLDYAFSLAVANAPDPAFGSIIRTIEYDGVEYLRIEFTDDEQPPTVTALNGATVSTTSLPLGAVTDVTLSIPTTAADGDMVTTTVATPATSSATIDLTQYLQYDGQFGSGFVTAADQSANDADGDGISNCKDLDSDNDGISDLVESGADAAALDPDGNGTIDGAQFTDSNDDGLADAIDLAQNGVLDGTGTDPLNSDDNVKDPADYLDLDSDDDGISDFIEAQPTDQFETFDNTDSDGDGVLDAYDGVSGFGGAFDTPTDTEGDGTADYIDEDSDNDAADNGDDAAESGLTLTGTSTNGIDDGAGVTFDDQDGAISGNGLSGLEGGLQNTDSEAGEVDFRSVDAGNQAPVDGDETNAFPAGETDPVTTLVINDETTDLEDDNDGSPKTNVTLVPGSATTDYPNAGGIAIVGDTIVYTPTGDEVPGTEIVITYEVVDSEGLTDTSTVTITVGASLNEEPAANPDAVAFDESDDPYVIDVATEVLANDDDGDEPSVLVTSGPDAPSLADPTVPGTVSVDGDGNIVFTPDDPNFTGDVVIDYTISDPNDDDTSSSQITLTITPVNDLPEDGDETDTVQGGTDEAATANLLANATDVEDPNSSLTVVNAQLVGADAGKYEFTIDANGVATVTPIAGETWTQGDDVQLTYDVQDSEGGVTVEESVFSFEITKADEPPIADPDEAETPFDTVVTVDILGNDTDPDGDDDNLVASDPVVETPGA
ncbi:MAG: cadherin-like domain-containing protein, partial [Shimia sp.]